MLSTYQYCKRVRHNLVRHSLIIQAAKAPGPCFAISCLQRNDCDEPACDLHRDLTSLGWLE